MHIKNVKFKLGVQKSGSTDCDTVQFGVSIAAILNGY